ncbi:MAG: protein-L-isoaspartate(D-aspartate) O-methyltransferase [Planctomycetes bacterium]|nr:protein-L-isoaspartate(D-aspartate) O-methyltransferase [Planctomycetota bacterium]
MVREQLAARGIKDGRLLAMMRVVPRHRFVEAGLEARAYEDGPLPIGFDATISQPYVVAAMTELLRLRGTEKVLEIGTGSGYQTAVLAELAGQVLSIEIVPELHARAAATLDALGYRNVRLRCGDGAAGWPEEAPFDAILVTAAPPDVPDPLLAQLAVGGRLVIPIGKDRQTLHVLERTPKGVRREKSFEVRFVPLLGEKGKPAAPST